MLLPLDIEPSQFGLSWGQSKEACATILHLATGDELRFLGWVLTRDGQDYAVQLWFGSTDALEEISVEVKSSRPFWHNANPVEIEETYQECQRIYWELIDAYSRELKEPSFSGTWEDADYPEDASEAHLTVWITSLGRFRLSLDQAEQEDPIRITIALQE